MVGILSIPIEIYNMKHALCAYHLFVFFLVTQNIKKKNRTEKIFRNKEKIKHRYKDIFLNRNEIFVFIIFAEIKNAIQIIRISFCFIFMRI